MMVKMKVDSVSGDKACESSSDISDSMEQLEENLKDLEISVDESFMEHVDDNIGAESDDNDMTCTETIEMDISSELEPSTIDLNVPIPLLPQGYEAEYSNGIDKELSQIEEAKFVCSCSTVKELFTKCLKNSCQSNIVEMKESYVGCTLEMRWECQSGHSGILRSSDSINNIYVNNMQLAASLLFSGNNFTKMSLYAKCFHLAFISYSTFLRCQKKFLIRTVNEWWTNMQGMMFKTIGSQPIVISGDGQMDSPGFSAKNCTYTLMHVTTDYILAVEFVDVRHSQLKSAVMEKVGCERALDSFMAKVNIEELVTDASSQVIKLLGTLNHVIILNLSCVFTCI